MIQKIGFLQLGSDGRYKKFIFIDLYHIIIPLGIEIVCLFCAQEFPGRALIINNKLSFANLRNGKKPLPNFALTNSNFWRSI